MRVYKPSGIKWLGEIPQSWEIVKIKQVSKVVTGKTPCLENEWGNEMPFITPTDCFLDTKYTSLSQRKLSKIGIKNYNSIIIPQDSILVTCIASIGKVVMSNKEVITNQQINSVIPNTDLISPDFAFYVLLVTMPFAENYFCGYSILPILNKSEFSNIKIPLPPLQEQKEIAEFLDKKCEKIQNYIDKKQKLITLLQEKKQALINEVVTKGLNPNIEFKNSEIAYLGLIPHHWEVRRMKFMASIHNGREQTEIADENGIYPIYGSGGILGKSMYFIYDKPSVLLGRKGTIDKPLFVEEPFWTIDTMFYTSVSKIVLPKYFYYLCLTIDFQFYISGSAIPSMTQYDLANISFALPPLQEQKQIANFLDEKCEKINSAIEKTKKQIELIKEYKNTLINEAVCGRINLERK
ncbi:restriction endonuclease subunit S [Campylobacter upsaliensis]|nr:restriction endonuclease subunit S [Campylobacter upsaliensis]